MAWLIKFAVDSKNVFIETSNFGILRFSTFGYKI